ALAPDEAAILLGLSNVGTLILLLFAGDDDAPAELLLNDWPMSRFARVFGGQPMAARPDAPAAPDSWYVAMRVSELSVDRRAALAQFLGEMESYLGTRLARLLKGRGVRRLTIVPHRWLHFVPFWALPSLADYEIVM